MTPNELKQAVLELSVVLRALVFHDEAAAEREGLEGCYELQKANDVLDRTGQVGLIK